MNAIKEVGRMVEENPEWTPSRIIQAILDGDSSLSPQDIGLLKSLQKWLNTPVIVSIPEPESAAIYRQLAERMVQQGAWPDRYRHQLIVVPRDTSED